MKDFILKPPFLMPNKKENYNLYTKSRYNRVLELGPLDGIDSVFLSKYCKELICIEGRIENVELIKRQIDKLGKKNIIVIHGNIETYDFSSLGIFDVVWASGIIYHMPNPIELIKRITDVTEKCFGWTHLTDNVVGEIFGYECSYWQEPIEHRLSGLSEISVWLSPSSFLKVWKDIKWNCVFTTDPKPHINGGLAAQFIGTK